MLPRSSVNVVESLRLPPCQWRGPFVRKDNLLSVSVALSKEQTGRLQTFVPQGTTLGDFLLAGNPPPRKGRAEKILCSPRLFEPVLLGIVGRGTLHLGKEEAGISADSLWIIDGQSRVEAFHQSDQSRLLGQVVVGDIEKLAWQDLEGRPPTPWKMDALDDALAELCLLTRVFGLGLLNCEYLYAREWAWRLLSVGSPKEVAAILEGWAFLVPDWDECLEKGEPLPGVEQVFSQVSFALRHPHTCWDAWMRKETRVEELCF